MIVVNFPGSLCLSAIRAAFCHTDIMSGPGVVGSVSTDGSELVACAPLDSVAALAASAPPAFILLAQHSMVLSPMRFGLPS